MFHDVDESLRTFLKALLPARTVISFEPPVARPTGAGQTAKRKETTGGVNLFLHDIREDTSGRGAGTRDIRDADNKVVSRRLPLRRYQMSYYVTAHAGAAEKGHQLLGQVLSAFVTCDVLPVACLTGSLAEEPSTVEVRIAAAADPAVTSGLWSATGAPLSAGIELVVVAPLLPDTQLPLGPPVQERNLATATAEPADTTQETNTPARPARFTSVRVKTRHTSRP
ncbi:Pvc16 family protein [Streptomyces sp. NPDC048419]|uniref:Pvc16 family protein n=1 Tax=Streptomyces sp. NPDC048419 TaxID=3365547 RepID=UPI00371E8F22